MISRSTSVVVATVRPRAVGEVIDALRLQTYDEDFEVVVVEGPPVEEGTVALASDIRVVPCDEANVSRARNLGIAAARGEIVAFIDDDAVPTPMWLSELLAPYDDPNVAATGGIVLDGPALWPWWGYAFSDRLAHVHFSAQPPRPEHLGPSADPFAYLAGCNMSFRRESLAAIGGFDEELAYGHDDADVCLRLLDSGALLRPLDSARVYHRSLPNASRGKAGALSDPYAPMRNFAYFAMRHGIGGRSRAHVDAAIDERAEMLRAAAHAALRVNRLATNEHERFLARIDEARAHGRERALLRQSNGRETPGSGWPSRRVRRRVRALRRTRARRPLRICMLAPEIADGAGGGIARVAEESARALAELGHELHVLSLDDRAARVRVVDRVWRHDVLRVDRRVPALRNSHVAPEVYGAVAQYHAVRRLHQQAPIDLVMAPTWSCQGLVCQLDGALRVLTRLVTPVARIYDLRARDRVEPRVAQLARLERAVLARARHLQAASHAICRDVEAAFELALPQAHVVPLTCTDRSNHRAERIATADEVEVLFVGRLEPRKGVDVLVRAAQRLVHEHPRVRFVFAGADNPGAPGYGEHLREIAEHDSAFDRRIRFLGPVDDERLWRLYAGADICCTPSRYESYGNVLVEALMFAKPVVACAAGGMPEVIEDRRNGLLAVPGDVDSLHACLAELIQDRELRARFGRRSRELYERRNAPRTVAERMESAYREIVAERTKASDTVGDANRVVAHELGRVLVEVLKLDPTSAYEASGALLDERAQLVDTVSESITAPALEDDALFLDATYEAVLSRKPDADGLYRWTSHLSDGGSRLDVLAELAASHEAHARGVPSDLHAHVLKSHRRGVYKRSIDAFVQLEDGRFLRQLHLGVLARRAPLPWVAENLDSLARGYTREDVARVLAAAPEAAALGVPRDWVERDGAVVDTADDRQRADVMLAPLPGALPLPPREMRELIGRAEPEAFDPPPAGGSVFPTVTREESYDLVLDFGCGCGRVARQLALAALPMPRRYVGVDLHAGMIAWAAENLSPVLPNFDFIHQNVYNAGFNPDPALPRTAPFPVADGSVTLLIASSIFTHLVQDQSEFYLDEVRRVLHPDGVMVASFFLFEKRHFPMMQDFQSALYINDNDPTNAVIFDRDWLLEGLRSRGLALGAVRPPTVRGFHWELEIELGESSVELPPDEAPFGHTPPPVCARPPHTVGERD